jgi:hypothetical protein
LLVHHADSETGRRIFAAHKLTEHLDFLPVRLIGKVAHAALRIVAGGIHLALDQQAVGARLAHGRGTLRGAGEIGQRKRIRPIAHTRQRSHAGREQRAAVLSALRLGGRGRGRQHEPLRQPSRGEGAVAPRQLRHQGARGLDGCALPQRVGKAAAARIQQAGGIRRRRRERCDLDAVGRCLRRRRRGIGLCAIGRRGVGRDVGRWRRQQKRRAGSSRGLGDRNGRRDADRDRKRDGEEPEAAAT